MIDEIKAKEIKGKAQLKIQEIFMAIGDGQNSLLQYLVKGYRAGGIPEAKAVEAFTAIKACVDDALANYHAAIAQPEPKAQVKPRLVF